MGDDRDYAEIALALHAELVKERQLRKVAEDTALMLQKQIEDLKLELAKSAEQIIELQRKG